jgi:hypothetical protein
MRRPDLLDPFDRDLLYLEEADPPRFYEVAYLRHIPVSIVWRLRWARCLTAPTIGRLSSIGAICRANIAVLMSGHRHFFKRENAESAESIER